MEEQGNEADLNFIPGLIVLGDFPPGSGLLRTPQGATSGMFARRTDVLKELGLAAPPAPWEDVLAYA